MQVTRLACLVVASALLGCGGGGGDDDGGTTGPPPPPPPGTTQTLGSITASPSSINLTAGGGATITIAAFDPQNQVIANPGTPTFTSVDRAVAEADGQGNVLGLYLGNTTVNVSLTLGGITRTTSVAVNVTGVLPNSIDVVASAGDYLFTPKNAAIQAGGSVTWSFGGLEHTVIFNSATGMPASIDGAGYNQAVSRTFATPGNFSYYCRIHAGMVGLVVVR